MKAFEPKLLREFVKDGLSGLPALLFFAKHYYVSIRRGGPLLRNEEAVSAVVQEVAVDYEFHLNGGFSPRFHPPIRKEIVDLAIWRMMSFAFLLFLIRRCRSKDRKTRELNRLPLLQQYCLQVLRNTCPHFIEHFLGLPLDWSNF